MTDDVPIIAPPVAADRPGWKALYQGYRRHHHQPKEPGVADTVWPWITRDDEPRAGRVARADDGEVIGHERGWSDVRWITSDDNYRARGFYDRVGRRTMMLTYEIRLGASDG